jgi:hypothetical protein
MTFFTDSWYQPPERLAIAQVTLDNNSPLTLSVTVKSFYMYDIYFDKAYIKDQYQLPLLPPVEITAEWMQVEDDEERASSYYTMRFLGELPGGSEKIITLNFNTTLPSGNYAVWLHTERYQTFFSPYFNIP